MPRKGDVNADGLVNANDIETFTQALLNNPAADSDGFYAADMNGDGNVDGKDIQLFVNKVLGL